MLFAGTGPTDGKRRYESATNMRTGVIIGVRAICGHSGRTQHQHSRFFLWHATKKMNMKSITEIGLLVGGHKMNRRQELFFAILDPCQSSSSGSTALAQSSLMSRMSAGTPTFAPYPYKGDIIFKVDVLKCHALGITSQQTVS